MRSCPRKASNGCHGSQAASWWPRQCLQSMSSTCSLATCTGAQRTAAGSQARALQHTILLTVVHVPGLLQCPHCPEQERSKFGACSAWALAASSTDHVPEDSRCSACVAAGQGTHTWPTARSWWARRRSSSRACPCTPRPRAAGRSWRSTRCPQLHCMPRLQHAKKLLHAAVWPPGVFALAKELHPSRLCLSGRPCCHGGRREDFAAVGAGRKPWCRGHHPRTCGTAGIYP